MPLPAIRVISFTRYFYACGLFYGACSVASDCQNNMPRSSERCERVDYVALNNLSSVDLEPAFKTKHKYKPGAKLYQVERFITKRKSATKPVSQLQKTSRKNSVFSRLLAACCTYGQRIWPIWSS